MKVNILQVEDILRDHSSRMTIYDLHLLKATREPYGVLLFQPKGSLTVDETGIYCSDKEKCEKMCDAFFAKAAELNVDLAVTPEYCVPVSTLEKILEGKFHPSRGGIWIVGCESITFSVLDQIMSRWKSSNKIWIYHEMISERSKVVKKFVDPLVYVFWSKDDKDNDVLCFLFQFKTTACKDYEDYEQRYLCEGVNIYRFGSNRNGISLISIICSDAFAFESLVGDNYLNTLIVHIQLNPKPNHREFCKYKERLCAMGTDENVELLCLNWAMNVEMKIAGKRTINWHNIAGSAWYVPPRKFAADDSWIDVLHKKGVYYSVLSKRWHSFFLNSNEQIVLLKKQKLFVQERLVLQTVTCLEVITSWFYDNKNEKLAEMKTIDSGFEESLQSYKEIKNNFLEICINSPLAVERILELLVGPTCNSNNWYKSANIESMHLAEDESLRMISICQNPRCTLLGHEFRKKRLDRAVFAIALPQISIKWPTPLKDLEDGFDFIWDESSPHVNIVSKTKKLNATLLYLGEETDICRVKDCYLKIRSILVSHANILCARNGGDILKLIMELSDRICVVYNDKFFPKVYMCPQDFREPLEPTSNSIFGE